MSHEIDEELFMRSKRLQQISLRHAMTFDSKISFKYLQRTKRSVLI